MENIWIRINRMFQNSKYPVGFIVIVIMLIVFVLIEMGKIKKNIGDSNQNAISESVSVSNQNNISQMISENKINSYEDVNNNVNKGVARIETFILLCNTGKSNVAYDMLTDDCKTVVYPTIQEFNDKYYKSIFSNKRNYNIALFKDNTYRVNYYVDSISSGIADEKGVVDYITISDDGKINISKFIASQGMNINSVGQYCTVNIKKRDTFVDYEEYTVSIKNNTHADIYVNDYQNSLLCIKNNKGVKFDLDNSEYTDFDYLVQAKTEEEFKFRFKMAYQVGRYVRDNDYVDITEMCFDNVKVVNQEYYDTSSNVVNSSTGNIEYAKKITNYPNRISFKVNFYNN